MSQSTRMYTSYTGVALPLKLVGEIDSEAQHNRNTYFVGTYDEQDRLVHCQRIVYGEVDLDHRYRYRDSGVLECAEITNEDGDVEHLQFDDNGRPIR
ncbi:DUF6156 family protein [Halioxenophilus sp. WMMB6]|uniref:DUF6156 family protein n=1 Tax=Halioxenophilus sp. WMMB6 TaxID=3073815 RepID=UPI00295EF287|nr:DUF6156 family protein [Halioxenophilus sp. WMMB6]